MGKKPKLSLQEFQKACLGHITTRIHGVEDLLDESDPYDCLDAMALAHQDGEDPVDFIEQIFEEDLARQEGDEQDFQDSLAYGEEE